MVEKMNGLILIILVIIATIVVVGIIITFIVFKKRKEGDYEEPDYQTFFILGICFLPIGIIFMIIVGPAFIGFTGLGLFYLTIGLVNKNKWKKG